MGFNNADYGMTKASFCQIETKFVQGKVHTYLI
jgi:hypothetical protein